MFRSRASLSAAAMFTIVGLITMGLGVFALQRGMRLYVDGAMLEVIAGVLFAGFAFVIAGGTSLGAGFRSFELFERKLLMTISSRGKVME